MSTLATFGERQQALLRELLYQRLGLTVDDLSQRLEISRNAVNQHIASLETGGFIASTAMSQTGGRPSRLYTLTDKGLEIFPRHYALFANLLVQWLRNKFDEQLLKDCLVQLGGQLALEFKNRVNKKNTTEERVQEVALILQELGYDARPEFDAAHKPEIVASNCVFHKLATECNTICELDLSLLSKLLNSKIEHKECMAKGGGCCRFGIK